jgi:septum formation protein
MSALIQPNPLILASASPRRAELLRDAGYQFDVVDPPMKEPGDEQGYVSAGLHAESLAYFKARSVADDHADKTILAADTIAALDGHIIGKPVDVADARRILELLNGTTHEVITGVALLSPNGARRLLQHDVSRIRVRHLDGEAIETYLATGQWRGKAGAYGIQDHGDAFVESVEGSFTNVVGLPLELLSRMFRQYLRAAS